MSKYMFNQTLQQKNITFASTVDYNQKGCLKPIMPYYYVGVFSAKFLFCQVVKHCPVLTDRADNFHSVSYVHSYVPVA